MAGPFDNLTFSFGGSDPTSYPAMQLRQRIALQMMQQGKKGYPKNLGEGLTAIGDAIGEVGMARRLERQQAAYEDFVKKNPPPDAAALLQQPRAAAPAAAGPRADASGAAVPDWLTTAQYPAAPPQATASASPQLPPAPVADASVQPAAADLQYPQTAAADTGTVSDAPPLGIQQA